jgi:hypothetical protein
MIRVKLMDIIFNPSNNLNGQVVKIRHSVATIIFSTGERIKKDLTSLEWNGARWQIRNLN